MEKQNSGFIRKFAIVFCIIIICFIGYFMVLLPIVNQGEGDLYFKFSEVPVNVTTNSAIIHFEDKDIMNIRGLDVIMKNGKISRIYFRNSQSPEINPYDFNLKYGSSMSDPSSTKYLEYKGVYYNAIMYVP